MKKIGIIIVLCIILSSFVFANGDKESESSSKPKIGIVVKIGGIPWFNAMEVGIKRKSKELGMDGFMGPTSDDPALQVHAVEDLIAQRVDVIGVVPNDANALEPVLKKARDAGIKVIMHESPHQKNSDWNFDLVSIQSYGESHAKLFAERTGGKGEYIVYVGGLTQAMMRYWLKYGAKGTAYVGGFTVPLHHEWADVAITYLEDNYPDLHLVTDKFGVAESVDDSYQTALDMMKKYPNLRGILTFGSQGPIGAARAVIDAGRVGKTVVIGAFSPGQGEKYVKGAINIAGYMWNPMVAGEVFVILGKMLLDGKEISDGMTVDGMGMVSVNTKTHYILGDKLQPINRDTIDDLVSLGL